MLWYYGFCRILHCDCKCATWASVSNKNFWEKCNDIHGFTALNAYIAFIHEYEMSMNRNAQIIRHYHYNGIVVICNLYTISMNITM